MTSGATKKSLPYVLGAARVQRKRRWGRKLQDVRKAAKKPNSYPKNPYRRAGGIGGRRLQLEAEGLGWLCGDAGGGQNPCLARTFV